MKKPRSAGAIKLIRRDAAELPDTTIAEIVQDALSEQALLDQLADAVRIGDEQEIVRAAQRWYRRTR